MSKDIKAAISPNQVNADQVSASARPKSARIDWVDYAKGFCIILVVMMHSTLGMGKTVGGEGWLHWFVEFARPLRMPDFFLPIFFL